MEEYFETATVAHILPETTESHERHVVLRIKNRTAKNWTDEIRKSAIETFECDRLDIKERKTYSVKLKFLDFVIKKIKKKIKNAVYRKRSPVSVNEYVISGQIVDETKEEFIIDCGIYIFISKPNKEMIKLGDWIQTRGRLDLKMAIEAPHEPE